MRLAAVSYDGGGGVPVDEVFAGVARVLREGGVSLAGVLQWNDPLPARRRCSMTLEDLASGRRILASEDRGPHARGCHLDAGALEEAAVLATASINAGTGFVIVNRFGKQEALGRGCRQVIEGAILLDKPVLVGVSEKNQAAWEAFAGDDVTYLSPSVDAILTWYSAVLVCQASFIPSRTHAIGAL